MTSISSSLSIAVQLRCECFILQERFKKKESLSSDFTVADVRLVPVQGSSDYESLSVLHSALVKCQGLMDKAMSKEEEEFGKEMGEYEEQRRIVYVRLKYLIATIGDLSKAQVSSVGTEVECPSFSTFELKKGIYRVFKEIDFWAKMTINTLQALHTEPVIVQVQNPIMLGSTRSFRNFRSIRSTEAPEAAEAAEAPVVAEAPEAPEAIKNVFFAEGRHETHQSITITVNLRNKMHNK